MTRLTRRAVTVAALAAATSVAQGQEPRFRVDPERYLSHVRVLSSDDLGGRGNGTPGIARAAAYIASEFRKARLEPAGDPNSFLQSFDIANRDDGASTLTVMSGGGSATFRIGLHYYPLSAPKPSAEAPPPPVPTTNPLVFAGYGISAPGLGYDDYDGVDVSGKAVVVFTHEPQENDPMSVFEGTAL